MFRWKTLVEAAAVVLVIAVVAGAVLWWLKGKNEPPPDAGAKHFRDVAEESGLKFRTHFLNNEQGETFKVNLYDHGSGVAIADYDGDGHDDVYLVNQLGENALFRNRGDGTFEDVTHKAGVALGDRICTAATFADYDNSGRQSLFITSTRGGNVLFQYQGDGTFKNVTKEAGLEHVGHSQAGFFFDYDGDGYLDLLVLQTADWTGDLADPATHYYAGKGAASLAKVADSPKEYNILYHNEPDGKGGRRFVDVTSDSNLKGKGWAADAAIFDYDGDGRPDVLITCMFGPSQLYHNDGGGKFHEVTEETLGRTPAGGMGAAAFDFDNDGKLDLYIVDMHSDMWMNTKFDLSNVEEKQKYHHMFIPDSKENDPGALEFERKITDVIHLPYDRVVFGNTFHHNLGGGKFEEISDKAGLETFWPWGIATGDFNNDGYEDVFVPSGMGYPWDYWPNRLLMNNGDGTFSERSREEGLEPPARGVYLDEKVRGTPLVRSSRAAAVADFDGDGRLDIVVNNFNHEAYYYKNESPPRHYVAFRLSGGQGKEPREGRWSNRDAVGAEVRLYAGGQVMTRQVNPAGGYLSQSSKTVHFGLGDRTQIDKVEIRWPSGKVQTLEKPAADTLLDVAEPEQ